MESLNKIEYKMTNFNRVETRIEYKRKQMSNRTKLSELNDNLKKIKF